jgi:hypothetical protein
MLPRLVAAVLGSVAVAAVVLVMTVADRDPAVSGVPVLGAAASRQTPQPSTASNRERTDDDAEAHRWRHVLSLLDARRERAWQLGRPELLRQVFTDGSSALRRDQRSLVAYLDRGLTVRGVSLELGSIVVKRRAIGRVRLLLVDRLKPVDVDGGRAQSVALPADRPTRHLIVLRHRSAPPPGTWPTRDRWLIARIALA